MDLPRGGEVEEEGWFKVNTVDSSFRGGNATLKLAPWTCAYSYGCEGTCNASILEVS